MPSTLDLLFHGTNLGLFAYIGWRVITRLNREDSLKRDYPPHRHVNGSVIYPQEYSPNEVGHLKT